MDWKEAQLLQADWCSTIIEMIGFDSIQIYNCNTSILYVYYSLQLYGTMYL